MMIAATGLRLVAVLIKGEQKVKQGDSFTFKLLDTFAKDGRRQAEVVVTDKDNPNGESKYVGSCSFEETRVVIDVPEIDEKLVVEFSPTDLYNLTKDDTNA